MPIVVKDRLHRRIDRRVSDYLQTLESGTAPAIGRSEPRPPDRRSELGLAMDAQGKLDLPAIEATLDQAWKADESNWQRRLQPFLERIGNASRRFARLVKAGCQPDQLAKYFYEATSTTAAKAKDETTRLRRAVADLLRLEAAALDAIRTVHERRLDFDKDTADRRHRVLYGDPGPAELTRFCQDFEDFVKTDCDELRHYLRQLDGRKQLLLTHPVRKLSNCLHDVTGRYHDTDAEIILDSLLENQGRRSRFRGTLKRQRSRWTTALSGATVKRQKQKQKSKRAT